MAKRRTVRGIRDTIPTGYIIGRLGQSDGAAELISLAELASHLLSTGLISSPSQANVLDLIDSSGFVLDTDNSLILVP